MLMSEIIAKKRDGHPLSGEEIVYVVNGYVRGDIPDYQMSSLLMAIMWRKLNARETSDLTKAMLHSGETMDLINIAGPKADKHSTGGVGDKTSLVLAPLVASCGIKVAKMSGRGLGHTGGTLDKLESIPGLTIELDASRFEKQVNDIGLAIAGQTKDIVPADKKIYALRDVTGTVENIGLIASSIMSKKLATGDDSICLDVKYGKGSFCKTIAAAERLARAMMRIGKDFQKDTRAVISNMNQPLGFAVGNILEVKEAIKTLQGKGPRDLARLCVTLGSVMLVQAGLSPNYKEAEKVLKENLKNGAAYERFKKMVAAQGGDVSYIDDPTKFARSSRVVRVTADATGYVSSVDALEIGLSSLALGAGRRKKEDAIDFTAGVVLRKKRGYKVKKGETLAYLYTNNADCAEEARRVKNAFKIVSYKTRPRPIVHRVLDR